MRSTRTIHRAIVGIGLSLLCGSIGLAQAPAKIRSVTRYVVTPGRVGDFRAAVKDYNAVLKKAEWDKAMTLWSAASGQNEFSLVRNHSKWAEMDVLRMDDPKLKPFDGDLRVIAARIMQCVISSERTIDELVSDVSLPVPTEMPKMVRVLRSRVRPDKVNEYMALYKSDVFPAAKKGGLNLFLVHRARFGAPSNQFASVTPVNSWADLDSPSPIVTGMGGQEAYDRFLTKIRPMLESSEYNIYRFEKELSYIPGKSGPRVTE